jgi:hypothetical protein
MFMHKKPAGITITIYFGYFFQYTVPASNNNLESSGNYIYIEPSLTFYALCPQTAFICFVWSLQQMAIITIKGKKIVLFSLR